MTTKVALAHRRPPAEPVGGKVEGRIGEGALRREGAQRSPNQPEARLGVSHWTTMLSEERAAVPPNAIDGSARIFLRRLEI